jgi:hypothetical protein
MTQLTRFDSLKLQIKIPHGPEMNQNKKDIGASMLKKC